MTWASWRSTVAGARTFGVVSTLAVIVLVELLIRIGLINPFIVPLPSQILAAIPRIVVEEHVVSRFWLTAREVLFASALLAVVGIAAGALLYRFRLLREATLAVEFPETLLLRLQTQASLRHIEA